ncbi:deoxynucleoside kinase [Agromyces endophyticus]|uniref:deoxynucleoside kinase n=1 Tax=Agromyces sp. H17E-10 TaxID=2932244 RepID=UPI001FD448C2|nr:deoxynucleoside kinase [Agromyces sp. H17E-10]UOQ90159.1 deoxynucleoside kinase [Agromyces sp. H17E-10]
MTKSSVVVSVLGNIAAGKTTIAGSLARSISLRPVLERPELNPFLPRLRAAPTRWCFANQAWYINEAANSLRLAMGQGGVLDHSLEELIEIHTPVFVENKWLERSEADLLTALGRTLTRGIAVPDVYVLAECPFEVLIERVTARGRGADRVPDIRYLELVTAERERFLATTTVPVVRVDTSTLDIRQPASASTVAADILRALA